MSNDTNYAEIAPQLVVGETDKAVKIAASDGTHDLIEVWLPKSVCELQGSGKDMMVTGVAEWFLEKNELEWLEVPYD